MNVVAYRMFFINLKNLFRDKKLYLVLDLDHTLLNSTRLLDITEEEGYLRGTHENLPGMTLALWSSCANFLLLQICVFDMITQV
jgi:hypothetical protein